LIEDWDKATSLPLSLREKLKKEVPLTIKAKLLQSKDKKTIKALLELEDGIKIESVLMLHNDNRSTVCVSSQAGCALGCLFCATGQLGFKRNLDYWEILEQVLLFARHQKISNVVLWEWASPSLIMIMC